MRLHLAFHFNGDASEWLHVPYPTDPPRYNIVPGQRILAVCNDRATSFTSLTWHEEPEERDAIRTRRCIVPVTGFFLWTEAGVPMFVARTDRKPLFIAASWVGEGEGRTGSLLMTPSDDAVGRLQPRMPLLLRREAWRPWLSRKEVTSESLQSLLEPDRTLAIGLTRVSDLVNDPANDRRECLLPA